MTPIVNLPKTLVIAAACALVWGFWLLIPGIEVLDRTTYQGLISIIPFGGTQTAETVWGITAIILGILPFIKKRPEWLRHLGGGLLVAFFIGIAVSVLTITISAPIIGIHIILGIAALDGIHNDRPHS